MSSNEQAFVKAFARRNRNIDSKQPPIDKAVAKVSSAPELTLDKKVAGTATIWIDPIEGEMARGDAAQSAVPRPHVEPAHVEPAHVEPRRHTEPGQAEQIQPEPIWRDDPGSRPAAPKPAPSAAKQLEDDLAASVHGPAGTTNDENGMVDEVARMVASLQQIHTAYATVESRELHWQGTLTDVATENTTPQPARPATAPQQAVESPTLKQPAAPKPTIAPEPTTAPEPVNEAMSTSQPRSKGAFQAAWEVDVFDIPKPVADLFFNESLFQDLSDRMAEAVAGGLHSMLVTSAKRGEGRSSVAIGMALAAADSGIRVALVDADIDDPTLADDMRLDLEFGWLDTLRSGLSVKEIAVHAVEDALTLIPLIGNNQSHPATATEITLLMDELRQRFDLIIIDGPAGNSARLQTLASTIDSAIIVRDASRTDATSVDDFAKWLNRSGVQGVGMVENFSRQVQA
ncbi:Septum site-determining protein MinD [Rubripirellula tenax]|uniref:Septum site-determining protein MinD n=1 Tax=Rubripirellula tenax TaxID=2528015 RepID=A0A5C6EP54_9BACT|nr:P-loop NTPase [Rubripirellula tenax]TWU50852.1 Septum site-determining protein MinD [Rubripirellula tenax]